MLCFAKMLKGSLREKLEATQKQILSQLRQQLDGMKEEEEQSQKKWTLNTFLNSRGLMQNTGLFSSSFVENVSWVWRLDDLKRWMYSKGESESFSLDEIQQRVVKRAYGLETVMAVNIGCKSNAEALASLTFQSDLVQISQHQLQTTFLTRVKSNANDYRVALSSVPGVGEVRLILPLTSLEASLFETIEKFSDESQQIKIHARDASESRTIATVPSAAQCSINSLFNQWINQEALLRYHNTETTISSDGKTCCLDPIRMGEIARLVLYLLDKYACLGIRWREYMTDQQLLKHCLQPVSAEERLREALYFDVQGDINPFVFLNDKPELCLQYAEAVIHRAKDHLKQDSKQADRADEQEEQPSRRDKPQVKVVDHCTQIVYRVTDSDGDTESSCWIAEQEVREDEYPLIAAIQDYKLTRINLDS